MTLLTRRLMTLNHVITASLQQEDWQNLAWFSGAGM